MSDPKIMVGLTREQVVILLGSIDGSDAIMDGVLGAIEEDTDFCVCARKLRRFFRENTGFADLGRQLVRDVLLEALDRDAQSARAYRAWKADLERVAQGLRERAARKAG